MSNLPIKIYPDPILRKKCQPVKKVTDGIKKLIDDMLETMHKNEGIGLAAPQVGVKKRVIVIDVGNGPLALVNPKIAEKEGKDVLEEGCLSLPEIFVQVKRGAKIIIEGLDRKGKKIEIEATHLAARALQHEVDHLDGILIIDRIPFFKKRKLKEKLEKIKKTT